MIKKAQTIGRDEVTAAVDDAIALAKSRIAALDGSEVEDVSGGGMSPIVLGGYLLGVIKDLVD